MLNYLAEALPDYTIIISSTAGNVGVSSFSPPPNVKVRLFGKVTGGSGLKRTLFYLKYHLKTLSDIVSSRSHHIIYFELGSVFPSWFLKKILRTDVAVYAHFHEYFSPGELQHSSRLMKLTNRMNRNLLKRLKWISHIHPKRLELFWQDNQLPPLPTGNILPNYPPSSWHRSDCKDIGAIIRIVYVGALGIESMYVESFSRWVSQQNGYVRWDIYAATLSDATVAFLKKLDSPYISFKGKADYFELPQIFSNYDVGVVLYKGVIPNHVHAISNKVFEYAVCGLDVWVSDKMEGTMDLLRDDARPKIIAIDFDNMTSFMLNRAIDHENLPCRPWTFNYETALAPLKQVIKRNS